MARVALLLARPASFLLFFLIMSTAAAMEQKVMMPNSGSATVHAGEGAAANTGTGAANTAKLADGVFPTESEWKTASHRSISTRSTAMKAVDKTLKEYEALKYDNPEQMGNKNSLIEKLNEIDVAITAWKKKAKDDNPRRPSVNQLARIVEKEKVFVTKMGVASFHAWAPQLRKQFKDHPLSGNKCRIVFRGDGRGPAKIEEGGGFFPQLDESTKKLKDPSIADEGETSAGASLNMVPGSKKYKVAASYAVHPNADKDRNVYAYVLSSEEGIQTVDFASEENKKSFEITALAVPVSHLIMSRPVKKQGGKVHLGDVAHFFNDKADADAALAAVIEDVCGGAGTEPDGKDEFAEFKNLQLEDFLPPAV